ncbi:MAG: flagellar assembly protein FliW [Candidatus Zixiibacteriota bacterium]
MTSKRFGTLEVPDNKIITMERPILGFEKLRFFCLVEVEELAPFLLMQSTEDTDVAFLVMNPLLFFPDYRIEINSQEIAELDVDDPASVETYVILTIIKRTKDITANLQGPILINTANNKAKQLVLVNSRYQVQHSVMEATEQTAAPRRRVRAEELAEV